MKDIYNYLTSPQTNVYYNPLKPYSAFSESDFTIPSEITIKDKTKNTSTFIINGQEFKMHFNEDCYRIQYYSGSKVNVSAYVESNGVSCELNYFSDSKITQDMCKAENAGQLKTVYTDVNGIEQKIADNYEISNTNEFKDCLTKLVTQTP